MEESVFNITMTSANEAPVKEALYALDEKNPLSLYDCLVPEITAHQRIRMPATRSNKAGLVANGEALLKLAEVELRIVSDETSFSCSL